MKDIIFDFGGVLVDWNPRYLYRKIFTDEQEMEYFLTYVCEPEWNAQLDAGLPFAEGTACLKRRFPQYAEQIAAYFTRWNEMMGGAVPGTHEIVFELKKKGYKVYGLTNWSAETLPLAKARFNVFAALDGMVVSGEEKLIKPDPRLYQILLTRFQLRAENCVFIDDNPVNISAARALGIDGIRFENAAQVRRELSLRHIL